MDGVRNKIERHENVYELARKQWKVDGFTDVTHYNESQVFSQAMSNAEETERRRRIELLMDQNMGAAHENRSKRELLQELVKKFQSGEVKEDIGSSEVCVPAKDIIKKTARNLVSQECEREKQRRIKLLHEMANGQNDLSLSLATVNDLVQLLHQDLESNFLRMNQVSIMNERKKKKEAEERKELLLMEIRRRSSMQISAIASEKERKKRIAEYRRRRSLGLVTDDEKYKMAVHNEILTLFGKLKRRRASKDTSSTERVVDLKTRVLEDLIRRANAQVVDKAMAAERKRRLREEKQATGMKKEKENIHKELLEKVAEV